MSLKYTFFFFLAFSAMLAKSQISLALHLVTPSKKPVESAIINYENKVYSSDKSGCSVVDHYNPGAKLSIKKLGFYDTTFAVARPDHLKDTLHFRVELRSKIFLLREIPVYSSSLRNINPMNSNFTLDYELRDDDVIELLSNNSLIIIDRQNQILSRSKSFPGMERMIKDPYGTIHILTEKYAYKTIPGSHMLSIDSIPVAAETFKSVIKYWEDVCDTFLFIRRYKDLNQTTAFFAASAKSSRLLKEISVEERKRAVKANAGKVNSLFQYVKFFMAENLGGAMGEIWRGDEDLLWKLDKEIWKQQLLMEQPSYNVLKFVNDSIYIFAHDLDSMFVYDKSCNLIRGKYIDYHHLKFWDKELIVNEEKTKVYARFVKDTRYMIAEVNLLTGELKPPFFKIESRSIPHKIKIRNNEIYYLAKQADGVGLTVYTQNLQL